MASRAKTSRSGSVKRSAAFQSRPSESSQAASSRIVPGDESHLGLWEPLAVRVRGRKAARHRQPLDLAGCGAGAAVAHGSRRHRGGAVPGEEDRDVDDVAVRAHREGARSVAEQRHDRRGAAGGVRGVEHPDVGAADPGSAERRIDRGVLSPVRGGDEGPAPAGAGEHDVAGLVADQQRPDYPRRRGAHVDHAHAVREVVHHPHLGCRARCDGDGLEADRYRRPVDEAGIGDVEDLDPGVGRVDGEQPAPVGGERQRPHLPALERDVAGARIGWKRGARGGGGRAGDRSREAGRCGRGRGTTIDLAAVTRDRVAVVAGLQRRRRAVATDGDEAGRIGAAAPSAATAPGAPAAPLVVSQPLAERAPTGPARCTGGARRRRRPCPRRERIHACPQLPPAIPEAARAPPHRHPPAPRARRAGSGRRASASSARSRSRRVVVVVPGRQARR